MSTVKILLVENDTLFSQALGKILTAQHYQLDQAKEGKTGVKMAETGKYDLIVLDLQIAKLDGISVCRQLRSQGYRKPILLTTDKYSNADILAGLDAGADDYVIKTSDVESLLARIQALLHKSGAISTVSSGLTWENICLDITACRVTYNGEIINFTATEYKLLELFLQHPNRIFSRSVILDRLWGFDDAPTENAVNVHIKDLRKKLKAAGLTHEFLETVYGMGYRLKPEPIIATGTEKNKLDHAQQSSSKDMTRVNRVIEKFRNSFTKQWEILEQAKTALLINNLTPELHQEARSEAHKLAGSMGSFGYSNGSKLAKAIENLLLIDSSFSPEQISRFSELIAELKEELANHPVAFTNETVAMGQTYQVLAIDDDAILMEKLQLEANKWGIKLTIAPNLATARSLLAVTKPDVILLDLSFAETEENGLILLREITDKMPNLPVIVFTAKDTLADRLAVSRLGAKQFLHKPATIEDIYQAITHVLPPAKTSEAKILIVDDDPIILVGLASLLTPWGLEVITLAEPEKFWQVLIEISPDLIILDLEMPMVSGLELCQIVRQDAKWGNLPILVVTAHTDAEALQAAFAAGADDFITKPILGPELVTRVISRIDRFRLHWKSEKNKNHTNLNKSP